MQRSLLAVAALLALPAQAETPTRDLVFDVLRKGELIGSHKIVFEPKAENLEVEVDIRLQIKLLFIPVYRYEHRNLEVWRDGKLVRIETRTDDNGREFYVRGAAQPDGFRVESSVDSFVAPEDVVSTSWWNYDTVKRRKLLNSQRGELMQVEIKPVGEAEVETAAGRIPARHYFVDGEAQLELWYDRDDRLAKIRFAGSDGTPIEYRRRD